MCDKDITELLLLKMTQLILPIALTIWYMDMILCQPVRLLINRLYTYISSKISTDI